jgi:hypothetical protein
MIGAIGFGQLLRHIENTLFITSLYEIDRIIEEKQGPKETNDQLVARKLPKKYIEYIDVFSKAASDCDGTDHVLLQRCE